MVMKCVICKNKIKESYRQRLPTPKPDIAFLSRICHTLTCPGRVTRNGSCNPHDHPWVQEAGAYAHFTNEEIEFKRVPSHSANKARHHGAKPAGPAGHSASDFPSVKWGSSPHLPHRATVRIREDDMVRQT